MTHSFPNLTSFEAFAALRADPSQWLPIAIDIARSHSLPCADPHVFSTGTNLVVGLNSQLIRKRTWIPHYPDDSWRFFCFIDSAI